MPSIRTRVQPERSRARALEGLARLGFFADPWAPGAGSSRSRRRGWRSARRTRSPWGSSCTACGQLGVRLDWTEDVPRSGDIVLGWSGVPVHRFDRADEGRANRALSGLRVSAKCGPPHCTLRLLSLPSMRGSRAGGEHSTDSRLRPHRSAVCGARTRRLKQ